MKTKIAFSLDEYDAALLDKAVRVIAKARPEGEPESYQRRFLMRWIIRAGCAALIRAGKLSVPLGVELRAETPEETQQRLAKEIPAGPDEPDGFPPFDRRSYPWN